MYSLKQSKRLRGHAGEPLPTVFPSLEKAGTKLLLGQLALVVAGPGVGKSIFALTTALKSGVPTLYFSADSDAATQLIRSICVLYGVSVQQATAVVLGESMGEYEEKLANIPIRFSYDASPTLDDVERSVQAYEEVYGEYPQLVIVDNITNLRTESAAGEDDPFGGLEALLDYLHTMARSTGSCVMGLHHVTGRYNDSDTPVALSGIKGQVGRVPELILTLHRRRQEGYQDLLCVSTVKQRGGQADPSGRTYVELAFHGERMAIEDLR